MFKRSSGILLHPTSLPSRYGIGELGGDIYRFIDILAEHKQTIWQVLPLGPTGFGDSPYQSFSSFAGNPLLISIEELLTEGLLTDSDLDPIPLFPQNAVDFGEVSGYKERVLNRAFGRYEPDDNFDRFVEENQLWLDNFAIFMALKHAHDLRPWSEWSERYRDPSSPSVSRWREEHQEAVDFELFKQYMFDKQWRKVKEYASSKNIQIVGDIPIYVAFDSADLWANQDLFLLDERGLPRVVAGVPPDYFSSTGQLWGNPIYNWEAMEERRFTFWVKRLEFTLKRADIIRLDHFLGFEAYWEVPYGEETAINGRWVKGPGEKLFSEIERQLGKLPLIAEDLGVITPEVTRLRRQFGFPGMKILQHAFSHQGDPRNIHLPHNYERDSVVYTGTHDNETIVQWYAGIDEEVRRHFLEYTGSGGEDIVTDMIRLASSSVAQFAIFPLQDILRLPASSRMNLPGTSEGNWKWRFTWEQFRDEYLEELAEFTALYGRVP